MRLGILASGELGFEILQKVIKSYSICFVMTDKQSISILEYCIDKKIPVFVGNPRSGASASFYKEIKIDVLISVNYIFIIEQDLIELPKFIAFNIHGSLLPKYRGRTPHVWAIINNEIETGITAHLIDSGCDTGPIIQQTRINIDNDDTGGIILGKFKQLYYPLIESVLTKISNNALEFINQDETKASFFDKRTANDGKINWEWEKERIRNWVRAQANPYPGAFTYFQDVKLIIDEIEYDDTSFTTDMPNGLVLNNNPFLVKTSNGVVKVSKVRYQIAGIKPGILLN
jgi:methionyl-tRNA formyltransferase